MKQSVLAFLMCGETKSEHILYTELHQDLWNQALSKHQHNFETIHFKCIIPAIQCIIPVLLCYVDQWFDFGI